MLKNVVSWNKRRKTKAAVGGAEIVGGKFIVIFNKESVFTEKQCFIMSNYKNMKNIDEKRSL